MPGHRSHGQLHTPRTTVKREKTVLMSPTLGQSRIATVPDSRTAEHTRPMDLPYQTHGPQCPDEILISIALTTTWMLVTSRRLDQPPLLHELTADQLIDFWADDHTGGIIPAPAETGTPCSPTSPQARRPIPRRESRF
jgi:hypothetical protein